MHKKTKILIGSASACLLTGVLAASVVLLPTLTMALNTLHHKVTPVAAGSHGDRIHFLNTRSADAILLESNGRYALIDAAEDSDNPRGFAELENEGTEQYVVDYVKKIAGDQEGNVTLEFVVGTHAHSDHLGGFDTVLTDDAITVKKAYLKKYDPAIIKAYEVEKWDNEEVYRQMMDACQSRNIPVVQEIPANSFQLGNFTLSFFNRENSAPTEPVGENENSLGILVEKDGLRAFLAGDINNHVGTETQLATQIGKVDLLKVGHHGYSGSTTKEFALALQPEIAVVTNTIHGINKEPLKALNAAGASIYATVEHDGMIAEFVADGIRLYDNL